MKIPNPFRGAKHIRCRSKMASGETTSVQASGAELEIPDNAPEVLIEAVTKGKSDAQSLAAKMWCKSRGFMEVQDFMQMKELEKKEKEYQKRVKKEKEAKEAVKSDKVLKQSVQQNIPIK